MGKPKENTIAKIDNLKSRLMESSLPESKQKMVATLVLRCHNMNIHKAKLVYFKEIKLLLTKYLAATKNKEMVQEGQWQLLEKELLRLLHAKNG